MPNLVVTAPPMAPPMAISADQTEASYRRSGMRRRDASGGRREGGGRRAADHGRGDLERALAQADLRHQRAAQRVVLRGEALLQDDEGEEHRPDQRAAQAVEPLPPTVEPQAEQQQPDHARAGAQVAHDQAEALVHSVGDGADHGLQRDGRHHAQEHERRRVGRRVVGRRGRRAGGRARRAVAAARPFAEQQADEGERRDVVDPVAAVADEVAAEEAAEARVVTQQPAVLAHANGFVVTHL